MVEAEFLPGTNRVITASADRMIRVWDFFPNASLVSEIQHKANVRCSRFSPDGTLLAIASSDGSAMISDVETGQPRFVLNHGGIVAIADFSPNGKYVVTGSEDGRVRVWSVEDGKPVTDFMEQRYVWNAEFHRDNQRILVGAVTEANIWDMTTGKKLHRLQHKWHVRQVRFSPSGKYALTCGDDFISRVWDVETGEPITPPLKHANVIEGGAFSPNEKYVVTGSWDHTAQIWEIPSGKKKGPPLNHFASVQNVSFTPDSKYVVTGSSDGTARMWNVSDGSPATPPMSMGRGLIRQTVSPCGRFIATAGFTPTTSGDAAMLWDVRTGRALGIHIQHDKWVNEVRFSPDSKRLATASEDGTARVWTIPEVDTRPVATLERLAHLISGHRADPVDGLVPLTAEEIQSLLEKQSPAAE